MATTTPSTLTERSALIGFVFAAFAAIGFSTKAILVKLVYVYSVDAVTLLALRMLFSTPFFLLVALRHFRRGKTLPLQRKDYVSILILGVLGYYLSSLFDFVGLQYISAGLERLILFLYPTMVVLISALLLGKRVGRREILALLLSYVGIGVVFAGEIQLQAPHIVKGVAFVFASTLTYSAYLIGTGEAIARVGVARFTALAMLVACVATLLQFLFTHPPQTLLSQPLRVYQLSAVMALVSTVLPVFMLSASIRLIGSGRAALIGTIGPVATLFMADAVLDERLTQQQLAGAGLVLLGVLGVSRK